MIYLDFSSTTPCRLEAVKAMIPYFSEKYGNPSSNHLAGDYASNALKTARKQIANLVGCKVKEVIFTSGSTESNNIIFLSLLLNGIHQGKNKVVISSIEHPSVREPAKLLANHGFEVIELPVDSNGIVDLEMAADLIDSETILTSVQYVNNETGVIQPIEEISQLAHKVGAWFHTDATQAVGKISINFESVSWDSMSFSSHKIEGPKGIGALIIANGPKHFPWPAVLLGGGQENGFRAGTENITGIVGFGVAAELTNNDLLLRSEQINKIRVDLLSLMNEANINYGINFQKNCIPNIISIYFNDIPNDLLLDDIRNHICLSKGSACSAGVIGISHVLSSSNIPHKISKETIRISLHPSLTNEDLNQIVNIINKSITKIKKFQHNAYL